jgi:hypothetical protein
VFHGDAREKKNSAVEGNALHHVLPSGAFVSIDLRASMAPKRRVLESISIGGVPVSTGHSAIEEHAEHGRSLVKTAVKN